jgi:hypothetical protein
MIKEIYISVDVESDGPIPGPYSLIALGAVVAGYRTDDGQVVAFDVTAPENRFYAEMKPISENWIKEAMQVGVFTGFSNKDKETDPTGEKLRAYLMTEGEEPTDAMTRFTEWVNTVKKANKADSIVFAAYPLAFDWMFVYWYTVNFASVQPPFGHSRHIDIKTLYSERSGNLIKKSVKGYMPKFLHSKLIHTHFAVDDAAEQGELLMNIFNWSK